MKDLIFVPLIGYEEMYLASNTGNIKSIDRYIVKKNGTKQFRKGKILNPSIDTKGYRQVRLQGGKIEKVSRLIAKTFLTNPNNLPQVNHINGIKTDDSVINLEWCSNSYNQIHAYSNGLQPSKKGINNPKSKLTEQEVINIKKLHESGLKSKHLADRFNISYSTINSIINGKSWKHLNQI